MDKRKLKILIIGDDLINSTNFSEIISEALPGTEITVALNGLQGLELAKTNEPDVILIDVSTIKAESLKISQIIKKEKDLQTTPMLFITDFEEDREFRKEALKAGAEAFVFKPIEDTVLITQLKAMAKIKERNILIKNQKEQLELLVEQRTRDLKQEINERKKLEIDLRKSEEMFRTYIKKAPIGILVIDALGRYIDVNERACEMMGSTKEELLRQSVFDHLSNGQTEKGLEAFQNLVDIGSEFGEYRVARKDSEEIDFPQEVIDMIYQHHERLDGSGYPQKLIGEQIIIEGRILAVADVVEAMMSHRPYRPALGIDAAIDEITMHRGVKYDSKVVDACIKLFREDGFKFSE